MKERTMQTLIAVLGALLIANLLRTPLVAANAQSPDAAPIAAVLRARMIELVDEKGQTRAQLKVEPDGEAVFRLRDARGTIRVKLGAAEDGSGLLLLDDNTDPAIHLLAKRGSTTVILAERGKDKRVITP